MNPNLLEALGYPINSFGLLVAAAFLAGTWTVAKRLRELGCNPRLVYTPLFYGALGGILASRFEQALSETIWVDRPFLEAMASWGRLAWYGGLMGGAAAAIGAMKLRKIPIATMLDASAPALAFGQGIGRMGCFLAGDDYGTRTLLPWGMRFEQGAPPAYDPVHPTQLYEMALLLPLAAWLWNRRGRSRNLLGEYLVFAALIRLAIENLRTNPKVLFGLTEAQGFAAVTLILGALLLVGCGRPRRGPLHPPGAMVE